MDIVISGLTKKYGENIVFDGFNARIRKNDTTFIMGPSGCGKTTLINIPVSYTHLDVYKRQL